MKEIKCSQKRDRISDLFKEYGSVYTFKICIQYLYKILFLYPYNRNIAPFLPRKQRNFNGVETKQSRLFDRLIPGRPSSNPQYESGLVSGIEETVCEGDTVVIVGGGMGVTATKAANKVGSSGKVLVFEGSVNEVNAVEETLRINGVTEIVDIKHSIVGEALNLRGKPGNAKRISPSELPECDVLELDCEGSEIEILEKMEIRPRNILVECHELHDAPLSEVQEILEENSYLVTSVDIADASMENFCERNGIYTLISQNERLP